MPRKRGGRLHRSRAFQIGGGRHRHPPHLADFAGDQAGVRQGPDPHGDIEVLVDEVEVAVRKQEIDGDLRVGVEEGGDRGRHVPPAEDQRRRHGDPAAQGTGRGLGADRGRIVGQHAARLVGELQPGVGRSELAGRALDQPHPGAGFQGRQRAGHRRRGAAQPVRRARQAARLQDRHEDRKFVQPVQLIIPYSARVTC
jgi:hypothetical protein